jgi:hypothetical protein
LYEDYQSLGYYSILVWDDSLDFMQDYFSTNGWTATDCYKETSDHQVMGAYSAAFSSGSLGHPQNALVDRDGNVRKYDVGAIDGEPRATQWREAIEELLGI